MICWWGIYGCVGWPHLPQLCPWSKCPALRLLELQAADGGVWCASPSDLCWHFLRVPKPQLWGIQEWQLNTLQPLHPLFHLLPLVTSVACVYAPLETAQLETEIRCHVHTHRSRNHKRICFMEVVGLGRREREWETHTHTHTYTYKSIHTCALQLIERKPAVQHERI